MFQPRRPAANSACAYAPGVWHGDGAALRIAQPETYEHCVRERVSSVPETGFAALLPGVDPSLSARHMTTTNDATFGARKRIPVSEARLKREPDAPLAIGPEQFAEPFGFARNGGNEVRFCDEDVALLREAEKGPLAFSVAKTDLGPLTGAKCDLGKGEPRVVSNELGLKWTPK